MSSGYFIENPNRGSFVNTSDNTPLTIERFYNLPFKEFTPKFYEIVPAKVVYVDYTNSKGRISAVKLAGTDSGEEAQEAFPLSVYNKKLPLVNDVVLLIEYPVENSKDTNEKSEEQKTLSETQAGSKFYYIDILNLQSKPEFAKNLYPLEGDIIHQGRNGQSIRFSTSIRKDLNFIGNFANEKLVGSEKNIQSKTQKKNSWIYGNNGNQPIIVISNGRSLTEQTIKNEININDSIEDVNLDDSSIYISSDNIIPLDINKSIYPSYFVRKQKINANFDKFEFSGKQILITSDNLIFNARNDIWLFSKNNIAINSTKSFAITSGENIVLEFGRDGTSKILLGKDADKVGVGAPVVKSDKLIEILNAFVTVIENGLKEAPDIQNKCASLRNSLEKMKSQYVYTL